MALMLSLLPSIYRVKHYVLQILREKTFKGCSRMSNTLRSFKCFFSQSSSKSDVFCKTQGSWGFTI